LRDADGVCGGAAAGSEGEEVGWPAAGVGYVVLVVRGVEILAVPAAIRGSVLFYQGQESKKLTLGTGCWNGCHRDMVQVGRPRYRS
jgi:hypothetical protein